MNTQSPDSPQANPTAVVVDTNAFADGNLTPKGIKNLRSLVELGLVVIVPDVVCTELASHAWQKYIGLKEQLTLASVFIPEFENMETVYSFFEGLIRATGAAVHESSASYYRQGLDAQIRQISPAAPKGDVTTGAADYIVYLHALRATEVYSTVAVITNDKVLRQALAPKQKVAIFPDFGSVRKGDTSHMRLSLSDAVAPLRYLLSQEFETGLASQLHSEGHGVSSLHVVGVGDLLRLNDRSIAAYVDLNVPVLSTDSGQYFGRSLERRQVVLDSSEGYRIESATLITTDMIAVWPPHFTSIAGYLSTELSMVPSVIRPVPITDYVSEQKTPITYEGLEDNAIRFTLDQNVIAEVTFEEYSTTVEYSHDGDSYIDRTRNTEIFLSGTDLSSQLSKGSMALILMREVLSWAERSANER